MSCCAAIVLALPFAHVGSRLTTSEQYVGGDDGGVVFYCVDSFHHAHRTRLAWENWPRPPFFDPCMNHPQGAVAQWPVGFDMLVATVLVAGAALSAAGSDWESVSKALPYVNIVIGLLTVLAFILVSRRFVPLPPALLGGLLLSLNLGFISASAVGNLDHHGIEVLGVILIIAVAALDGQRRRPMLALMLAAGLALVVWCSTFVAYLAAASLLVGTIHILAVRRRRELAAPAGVDPWFAVPFSALTLIICLLEAAARSAFFAFETLSLLQWSLLSALLLATHLASRIDWRWLAAVAAAVVAAALLVAHEQLAQLVDYGLGSGSLISNVNESRPLFFDRDGPTLRYVLAYFGVGYFFFPLILLHARRRLLRDGPVAHLIWFALVLFLLSLSQRRFLTFFTPAFVMLLLTWAWRAPRADWSRWAALAMVTISLLLPLWRYGPRSVTTMPPATREAITVARYLADLPAKPGYGVSAPPNMGSPIVYLSRRPSTSNAFYYRDYLELDLAARSAESKADLLALLRANRIDYLVAADDVRYRTMLLDLWRHELAPHAAKSDLEPCGEAHLRYAYYRLACRPSSQPGFELLHTWRFGRDSRRLYRSVSIYEVEQR